MADEKFETNLLKMIAAELYFLLSLQASREMYGKSYFSLGIAEKAAIEQTVQGSVGGNFQLITPDLLKAQPTPQGVGFQVQTSVQEKKS